jgi:hypothetical protein
MPAKRGSRLQAQEGPGSSDSPCQQQQQRREERQRLLRRPRRHDAQHPPPPLASTLDAVAQLEALTGGGSSSGSDSSSSSKGEPARTAAGQPWLSPRMALLAAAALWGSYTVSVRLLYSTADPPDAAVIMACRGLLQAAAMLAISSSLLPQQAEDPAGRQLQQQPVEAGQQRLEEGQARGPAALLRQLVSLEAPPLWLAAAELGLWNYAATSLQASYMLPACASVLLCTLYGTSRMGGRWLQLLQLCMCPAGCTPSTQRAGCRAGGQTAGASFCPASFRACSAAAGPPCEMPLTARLPPPPPPPLLPAADSWPDSDERHAGQLPHTSNRHADPPAVHAGRLPPRPPRVGRLRPGPGRHAAGHRRRSRGRRRRRCGAPGR